MRLGIKAVIPNQTTVTIGGLISRGVKAVEITAEGKLVFTLTDGSTVDLGSVMGPQGPKGENGAAGASVVSITKKSQSGTTATYTMKLSDGEEFDFDIETVKGEKGDTGAPGPAGQPGQKGETGKGLTVKGYYGSLSELQTSVENPEAGDAYGVGADEPYDIYIYDGVTHTWVNNGPLQGAKGEMGATGPAGKTPVKGTDYFTEADKQEIAGEAAELVDVSGKQNKITAKGPLRGDGNGNVTAASTTLAKRIPIPTGILKGTAAGGLEAATPGTDYLVEVPGTSGQDGTTFTPSVSEDGVLSWTNDGGKQNPASVNIKGQTGAPGTDGLDGATFTPSVSSDGVLSWTNDGGKQNPASVNIRGPAGAAGKDPEPFYVNCTVSGPNLYDEDVTHDKTYAEILAAHQAGRPCYAVLSFSNNLKFYLPLTRLEEETAVFSMTQMMTGDTPEELDVYYVSISPDSAEGFWGYRYTGSNSDKYLPAVTASDNGKFLQVTNGAWAAVTIPDAEGDSY